MKLKHLFFPVMLLLFSCSSIKTNNYKARLSEDRSIYFFEQSSPYINLPLFGDYKFQPLATKYFRDIDSRFIKYATLKLNNIKPVILYSAHTYVQPFYSTICAQYKDCGLDTILINHLKADLKAILKTSLSDIVKIKCGTKDVYKIVYQATNSVTKIYSSNTEYFFAANNAVYRLFFWTTNNDNSVLANEAEYIIKEARFD